MDNRPCAAWWRWYLSPPEDWRKKYGNALEFDALDRYYQALYEQKQKEKQNGN